MLIHPLQVRAPSEQIDEWNAARNAAYSRPVAHQEGLIVMLPFISVHSPMLNTKLPKERFVCLREAVVPITDEF